MAVPRSRIARSRSMNSSAKCQGRNNGRVHLPPDACEEGFAHCTFNAADGCESDLSSNRTCGSCYNLCPGPGIDTVDGGDPTGPRTVFYLSRYDF